MHLPTDQHNQNLSRAFDGQAAKFERAPVQSDPRPLERLVRFADLPADSLVFDAGCGPGLVAEALSTPICASSAWISRKRWSNVLANVANRSAIEPDSSKARCSTRSLSAPSTHPSRVT